MSLRGRSRPRARLDHRCELSPRRCERPRVAGLQGPLQSQPARVDRAKLIIARHGVGGHARLARTAGYLERGRPREDALLQHPLAEDHRARTPHALVDLKLLQQGAHPAVRLKGRRQRTYIRRRHPTGLQSAGQRGGDPRRGQGAESSRDDERLLRYQHARCALDRLARPAGGRDRSSFQAVAKEHVILEAAGHELRVSSPSKVFFTERGLTTLDLVNYYLECDDAVVRHLRDRPTVMKRWVDGVEGEPFFQKRVPATAPDWLQTATVAFPSGRHARELTPNDAAHLVWGVNLGVIDWNPWPVRSTDLDHPDELRVDLDPGPGVPFAEVREVALEVRAVLEEHGLRGFPKTSGSRGMHIYVRLEPSQSFEEVRRAALALAREVERRMPSRATSRWGKEEREGVFIDYNQNARDRTVASAYSVRAVPA